MSEHLRPPRPEEKQPEPRLLIDYAYAYRGYDDEGGICRIRIYEREERPPVVIVTELDETTNTSVTNMAEYLVPELVAKHSPERFDEGVPMIWVEHYPRTAEKQRRGLIEYSIVTFEHFRPRVVVSGETQRITAGAP